MHVIPVSRRFLPVTMPLVLVFALSSCKSLIGPVNTDFPKDHLWPKMIGSDPLLTVRNECWYAIDKAWLSKPNDPNGPPGITKYGKTGLSNWNYLSQSADANANALRWVLFDKGGFVSNVIPGIGGDLSPADENKYALQLSNDKYGLNGEGLTGTGPTYQGVGHGTQCVSFVEMIILRARGGLKFSWPSWSSLYSNRSSYQSATSAKPGDLVFYVTNSSHGHVGVCVVNNGSGIWVVDSNFILGDGKYNSSEVIARHWLSNTVISNGGWKRFRWY